MVVRYCFVPFLHGCYVPVCNITAAKNKFVPVFSYFIKLSSTNAYGLVDNFVRD